MRPRDKIFLPLFGLTLIVGALVIGVLFSAPTDMASLRWQMAQRVADFLADSARPYAGVSNLSQWGYVGLVLFAVLAIVALLRALRDRELLALKQRLGAMTLAQQEADRLLAQERARGKQDRNMKDAALRDLDLGLERIDSLLSELREKEQRLNARDAELFVVKADMLSQSGFGTSLGQKELSLYDELRKTSELLQARDLAIADLERMVSFRTKAHEQQLAEKEHLLKERDRELTELREELALVSGRLAKPDPDKLPSE